MKDESQERLLSRSSSPPSAASRVTQDEEHRCSREKKVNTRLTRVLLGLLAASTVCNIMLGLGWRDAASGTYASWATLRRPTQLYSPAQDVVEYQHVRFTSSIHNGTTAYQGPPNEENTRLWKNLHAPLMSHVNQDQARLLPNRTAPEAPYHGSGYALVLNVFHDLHCIDTIRRAMYYFLDERWNTTHNPYTLYDTLQDALFDHGGHDYVIGHMDHCIDALRQSTQCNADITPNVFQYSPKVDAVRARATVVHECRNFERVRQWAIENEVTFPLEAFGDAPELGKCAFDYPETCKPP